MIILVLALLLLIGEGKCAPLPVENNQHIDALISPVKLTRLAVENDRILEAFLFDETVIIEKDERLGQLFLYPKDGALEVSLTIATEKGLNVDLTLQVSEQAGSAIVLKPKNTSSTQPNHLKKCSSPISNSEPFQKKTLGLMRYLFEKRESIEGGEDRTYPGFYTVAIGSLVAGEFEGTLFKITNQQGRMVSLNEMDFVKEGDIALSFLNRILNPKESTDMMIVRKISDDLS